MKKIMFKDKYGLTEAVLNGMKTQTRRVINSKGCNFERLLQGKSGKQCAMFNNGTIAFDEYPRYQIGDVVAIAQSYNELYDEGTCFATDFTKGKFLFIDNNLKGWNNKMFVKASLMPHHIKITNVRVERLQDISDADCLEEGIYEAEKDAIGKWVIRYGFDDTKNPYGHWFKTPKEAYASLIDKVGKKGTWDSNPWVFVYDFKLID